MSTAFASPLSPPSFFGEERLCLSSVLSGLQVARLCTTNSIQRHATSRREIARQLQEVATRNLPRREGKGQQRSRAFAIRYEGVTVAHRNQDELGPAVCMCVTQ